MNKPWLLAVSALVAIGLQGSALALYEVMREAPRPSIKVKMHGEGSGTIEVFECVDGCEAYDGTSPQPPAPPTLQPLDRTCSGACTVVLPLETKVILKAKAQEESVFSGFGGCKAMYDPTQCLATVTMGKEVHVKFDKINDDVEIAFSTMEELDQNLEDKDEQAAQEEEKKKQQQDKKAAQKPEEKKKQQQLAQKQQQQQKLEQPKVNMKSVEVNDKESIVDDAPDDAQFLSDENRNVQEETRAEKTNLQKAQDGAEEQNSEQSENTEDPDPGARETVVADAEQVEVENLQAEHHQHENATGEKMAMITDPTRGQAGQMGSEDKQSNVLDMRGIRGRGSILNRPPSPSKGSRGLPGLNFAITQDHYEKAVGKEEIKRQQELGRKWMSKQKGNNKYQRRQRAVKMALENFNTEVKVGNQTRLKTRRAPFAVYLARMHREIHRLWGFGYLVELDKKGASHPLNNWDLRSELEIIVNPDGTIDRINIVKHSGILEFDVAAIDTILSAGPFSPPPSQIRSPDGKVYIHWGFFRNHRQCGTFNAQPHILDSVPKSAGKADSELLTRNRKGRTTVRKEIQKQRNSARKKSGLISTTDPEVTLAANIWVTGFARGHINRLLRISEVPFRSGEDYQATNKKELRRLYKTVLDETKGKLSDWKILTANGYRKRFRTLPPGLVLRANELLLAIRSGKDLFVIVLAKDKDDKFHAVGLYR